MSHKEINLDEFYSDFQEDLGDLYDGAQKPSEEDQQVQEIIDQLLKKRYDGEDFIAEGGMKKIIRSRDSLTSRDVAIAFLKPDKKEKLTSFIKEARLNARLQHPNIMTVYDIGVDDNQEVFFTMKLIEGQELGDILKSLKEAPSSTFDLQRLLYIFLKICEAISFAHSKKILHLDLKPENIQVGRFGEVLVCDWGLAKDLNAQKETSEIDLNDSPLFKADSNLDVDVCSTLDGIVKGSLGYMAPEQAEGRNKEKDERTDIYSLGAILYSILTYENSVNKTDIAAALTQCVSGAIQHPSQRVAHKVPEALEAVTLKAMALKPEARYQTVDALVKDIEAYLGGFATSAEDADFITQIKLLIKRNKTASSLMTLSFLIICFLVGGFIQQISTREKEAVLAKEKAEKLQAMAEKEKRRAEDENKLRMELSSKAAPAFFRRSQLTWKNFQFQAFQHAIKMTLELNPNSQKAWNLYAFYLLGNMEFDRAESSFQKGFGGKAYKGLIQKWKTQKVDKSNVHLFIFDLQKLNLNREIALVMNHFQSQNSYQEKYQFLAKTIKLTYQNNSPIEVDYNIDQKSIKVIGKHFRKNALLNGLALKKIDLSNTVITTLDLFHGWALTELNISKSKVSDISPLKTNPIVNLDISYTSVNDINIVQSLPIKSLNIAGLRLKNLAPLLNCPSLEKVTLSKDMAQKEQNVVSALKERCQVIIIP
ncbi:serine/threonine-protein kinase [Lentisphaera marina]|uniref:serine/threonine-protein kinase n=1 Tax=Lentisphaera marina TaxID=1111041 RepID=UPI0023656387|nr:serine/threonine-protein kinase [Lentisphaera marina]MDD7985456.1 serine/threonine-protein kinase [Lentisphaera marina]